MILRVTYTIRHLRVSRQTFFLVFSIFFFAGTCNGAVRKVPSTYPTIAQAISVAKNGDTIEIEAGLYSQGIVATINKDNLVIRGVGGRAHLNGSGIEISNGKAIFVTTGKNITLENIEFSGAKVPDENGAGIRHEGGLLTIKNCYFHDNENGILTSGQGEEGELVVDNSEFRHNGLGRQGYTHNIYVGNIGRFIFRYSYSHHTTHGHNIKSRAEENYILYSRIMDETTGNASYQIDLPNGGLSFIIGNSIHQGVNAINSAMISYAAEGPSNTTQEIYVSGNTFVNDKRPAGRGIRLIGPPFAVIRNNIFDHVNEAVVGDATVFENNLESKESGFVNRQAYDYHLVATSDARNLGKEPGIYHGMNLRPTREYKHPLQSTPRMIENEIDAGAFELNTVVVPPNPNNLTVVPGNFILLRSHEK